MNRLIITFIIVALNNRLKRWMRNDSLIFKNFQKFIFIDKRFGFTIQNSKNKFVVQFVFGIRVLRRLGVHSLNFRNLIVLL